MKRILIIVMLAMLLQACSLFAPETTVPTTVTTYDAVPFIEDLAEFIENFGEAEDVDYGSSEDGTIYVGFCDMVAYKRGEDISVIIADNNVAFYVDFYLEPGTATTLEIWSIDFMYSDPIEQVYLYVSYYHYGDWLLEDYRTETYNAVFSDFLENVDAMTLNDWLLLLETLGHYTPNDLV